MGGGRERRDERVPGIASRTCWELTAMSGLFSMNQSILFRKPCRRCTTFSSMTRLANRGIRPTMDLIRIG